MIFSFGYQILNWSSLGMITQSVRLKIPLKNSNEMIVYLDKFQAIVVKRNNEMKDSYSLNITQELINSENNVKLLGVEIDNKFSFEKHISTLVKKASN